MSVLKIKPELQKSEGTGKVYSYKPTDGSGGGNEISILIEINGDGLGELKAYDGDTELELGEYVGHNSVLPGVFYLVTQPNKEIKFTYGEQFSFDGAYLNGTAIEDVYEDKLHKFNCTFTENNSLLEIYDYNFA